MSSNLDDPTRFQDWMNMRHIKNEKPQVFEASPSPPTMSQTTSIDAPSAIPVPSTEASFLDWMQTKGTKMNVVPAMKDRSVSGESIMDVLENTPELTFSAAQDASKVEEEQQQATHTGSPQASDNITPLPMTPPAASKVPSSVQTSEAEEASRFLDWMYKPKSTGSRTKSTESQRSVSAATTSNIVKDIQHTASLNMPDDTIQFMDWMNNRRGPASRTVSTSSEVQSKILTTEESTKAVPNASKTAQPSEASQFMQWATIQRPTRYTSTSTRAAASSTTTINAKAISTAKARSSSEPRLSGPRQRTRPTSSTSASPSSSSPSTTPIHPAEKMLAAFSSMPKPRFTGFSHIPKRMFPTTSNTSSKAQYDFPEPTEESRRKRLAHAQVIARFIMHDLGLKMTPETKERIAREREIRHEKNRLKREERELARGRMAGVGVVGL